MCTSGGTFKKDITTTEKRTFSQIMGEEDVLLFIEFLKFFHMSHYGMLSPS